MKKIVLMLLSLIIFLSFTQAYTLTVTNDVETVTEEVAEGKRIIVGLSDRSPARYVVNVGNVILKVLGNRRTFTMPAENVDILIEAIQFYTVSFESNGGEVVECKAVISGESYGELPMPSKDGYAFDGWYSDVELTTKITDSSIVEINEDHTLYAGWYVPFEARAQLGDYVTYCPTETEVNLTSLTGISQTAFNPSATTQWRVLSNDGTTVELVSADSVGNLSLGSTTTSIAKANYVNSIGIFNTISKAYANEGIAVSGRGFGYNGTSVETFDTTENPLTYSWTYTQGHNGEPFKTGYRVSDIETVTSEDMKHSSGILGIAGRFLYPNWNSERTYFSVYIWEASENNPRGDYPFYNGWKDGSETSGERVVGIRPVVILNNGLKVNGDGTSDNPWIISEENNENIYTVSFNSEGSIIGEQSVLYGGTYGDLPVLDNKDGYVFSGWYEEPEYINLVTCESRVKRTQNHILYARWVNESDIYSVTLQTEMIAQHLYNLNDVSNVTSGAIKYSVSDGRVTITGVGSDDSSGYINARANLTAGTTYTFSCEHTGSWGWASGDGTIEAFLMLNGTQDTYYHMSGATTTFTPSVSGTYWLRFDANKVGLTESIWNIKIESVQVQTSTVEAIYGSVMPAITIPTRSGYTFGGYYTEENGLGTKYYNADGSSAKNWYETESITLYANWIANT